MANENVLDIVYLLTQAVNRGASDLHICVGSPPMARLHGTLVALAQYDLTPDNCRDLILSILSESQRSRLEQDWELDFALQIENLGRFRANAHYSRGALEAALRHIPSKIPLLDNIGHRPFLKQLCNLQQGLILVTGITGCGKSTTLASIIQHIGSQRSGVIITVEDPIEFIFQNQLSLVKQRELGTDTKSFAAALRHALRQDPDIIMISEMRDRETMQTAISAAETGHLVFATVHTIDAPKAIDRLIDSFPPDQQPQMIAQLSNCLQAVISQRLLTHAKGHGRVLASEIMVCNNAIRACLRDRRCEQIIGLMEISSREGMHTIDDSLVELLEKGLITKDEALLNARDPNRINSLGKNKKSGFFG